MRKLVLAFLGEYSSFIVVDWRSEMDGSMVFGAHMHLLLNSKQVADALGISVRSLERMRSEGTGPKFIRTSGGNRKGRVGYLEQDINEWLDARRRASTSDQGRSPLGHKTAQ